jgi:hypothetical protein
MTSNLHWKGDLAGWALGDKPCLSRTGPKSPFLSYFLGNTALSNVIEIDGATQFIASKDFLAGRRRASVATTVALRPAFSRRLIARHDPPQSPLTVQDLSPLVFFPG